MSESRWDVRFLLCWYFTCRPGMKIQKMETVELRWGGWPTGNWRPAILNIKMHIRAPVGAKNTRGVLIYSFWSLFLDPPTEINIFKLYFPTCWVEEAFFQPEVDDQQRQIGSRAGDPWMSFLSLDNYHYCLSLDYPWIIPGLSFNYPWINYP